MRVTMYIALLKDRIKKAHWHHFSELESSSSWHGHLSNNDMQDPVLSRRFNVVQRLLDKWLTSLQIRLHIHKGPPSLLVDGTEGCDLSEGLSPGGSDVPTPN